MSVAVRVPPLGGALVGTAALLSVLAWLSDAAQNFLVMKPGNTVLGQHFVWTLATYTLVERHVLKLALSATLVGLLSWIIERSPYADGQSARAVQLRVGLAIAIGSVVAGVSVAFSFLMLYTSSGVESYLYRSVYGLGPATAALAVCAHQVAGSGPAFPHAAPWLPASALPASVLVVEAVAQYGLRASRSFLPSCIAALVAWVYLRWVHSYAPGSVGDSRPEFEFLSMLPAPIQ